MGTGEQLHLAGALGRGFSSEGGCCIAGGNGMFAVLQHNPSGSKDEGACRQGHRAGASHVASSGSQVAVTDPC